MYGGLGMCWYWPLVISRSTQPTEALRIDDHVARRERRGSGAAMGSTEMCCSIASSGVSPSSEMTTFLPAGSWVTAGI